MEGEALANVLNTVSNVANEANAIVGTIETAVNTIVAPPKPVEQRQAGVLRTANDVKSETMASLSAKSTVPILSGTNPMTLVLGAFVLIMIFSLLYQVVTLK